MIEEYSVEFVRSAKKEFEKLPLRIRERAVEALKLLSLNPFSELLRAKKLRDAGNVFRIRLGDYRLVYEVRENMLIVLIIKIGHRRDVYRK